MLRLSLIFLLALGLCSCDSPPIDRELTGVCDDPSMMDVEYFDEVMVGDFFDVHCTVCHSRDLPVGQGVGTRRGAPQSFSYNVHDGAIISPEATWDRVADRTMPPMGREVSAEEADLLFNWLNCVLAAEQLDGDDDDDSAGDDDDDSGR
jgi:hypothetical protein